MNRPLHSEKFLTKRIKTLGINQWNSLLEHVQKLPYGRNKNRTDFGLVLSEGKGSCSSKHGLLKLVAIENKFHNVELILGLYKMNQSNTPGIKNELLDHQLEWIPEAHCYLKVDGQRTDLTSINGNFSKIEKSLLKEIEITPDQISEYKITYHQQYIKEWIKEEHIPFTFQEIWRIREKCIANLSK